LDTRLRGYDGKGVAMTVKVLAWRDFSLKYLNILKNNDVLIA